LSCQQASRDQYTFVSSENVLVHCHWQFAKGRKKKIIENPKSIWADMRFPYEPACCRLVGQYGRAGLFDLHGPDRLLL
jgi:hypothetical protein